MSGIIYGGDAQTYPGIATCYGTPDYVLPDVTGNCVVTSTNPPTATDNCAGVITGTTTDSTTYITAGTHIVNWTFNDGNGNISTQTQNFIVNTIDTSMTVNGSLLSSNDIGASYQWFDCNSHSILSGQTGQSYVATANGSYAVILNQGGCGTDTSNCYTISVIGVDELSNNFGVSIYPNPTSGIFSIDVTSTEEKTIIVRDVLGQDVFAERSKDKNTTVNLSDYNNGIFFITIKTATFSKTFKVIKNQL